MFKVMIADDNPYLLEELCDITDWEDFDLVIEGAYPDGEELLEAAKKNMPDLVITDIAMPVMDGITLAIELRKICPDIKIIFISSHADFEYARKAVQMHISGYILKPFEIQQHVEIMKKVSEELYTERFKRFEEECVQKQVQKFRMLALENYMCKLLYHPKGNALVCSQLEELNLSFDSPFELRVAAVTFDKSIEESYNNVISKIRSIIQGYTEREHHLILMPIDLKQLAILIIYNRSDLDIANLLAQINVDIETTIGLRSVMGFSMPSEEFSAIPQLYNQAQMALTHHVATEAVVVNYEEIYLEQSGQTKDNLQKDYKGYVSKMRAFIEEHYMETITTNDVASAVYLSSRYAHQCFSTVCGCTIFDYITQCRISEAKRLLSETDESVIMIADLVGYSGKTNFYLAFKRNVGMSPTEYRQQERKSKRTM